MFAIGTWDARSNTEIAGEDYGEVVELVEVSETSKYMQGMHSG